MRNIAILSGNSHISIDGSSMFTRDPLRLRCTVPKADGETWESRTRI